MVHSNGCSYFSSTTILSSMTCMLGTKTRKKLFPLFPIPRGVVPWAIVRVMFAPWFTHWLPTFSPKKLLVKIAVEHRFLPSVCQSSQSSQYQDSQKKEQSKNNSKNGKECSCHVQSTLLLLLLLVVHKEFQNSPKVNIIFLSTQQLKSSRLLCKPPIRELVHIGEKDGVSTLR